MCATSLQLFCHRLISSVHSNLEEAIDKLIGSGLVPVLVQHLDTEGLVLKATFQQLTWPGDASFQPSSHPCSASCCVKERDDNCANLKYKQLLESHYHG